MAKRHPPFSKLEILSLSRLVDFGNPEKWIGVPALQSLQIFETRITKGLAPSMVHFSVSRPSFNGESCHARLARRKRDLGGAWIAGTPLHSFSQQISVWFLRPSQVVSHNHSLDHTHTLTRYITSFSEKLGAPNSYSAISDSIFQLHMVFIWISHLNS